MPNPILYMREDSKVYKPEKAGKDFPALFILNEKEAYAACDLYWTP